MLDWGLYYRTGIALFLATIFATATAFYIEERYGVARYWAWGSALVVYLIVPVLWGLLLTLGATNDPQPHARPCKSANDAAFSRAIQQCEAEARRTLKLAAGPARKP